MIDLLPPFPRPPRVISPVLRRAIHCANASGRQDDSRRPLARTITSVFSGVSAPDEVSKFSRTPLFSPQDCVAGTGPIVLSTESYSFPVLYHPTRGVHRTPASHRRPPCESAEPAQDLERLSPSAAFGRRALVANALDFTLTTPPCDCSR